MRSILVSLWLLPQVPIVSSFAPKPQTTPVSQSTLLLLRSTKTNQETSNNNNDNIFSTLSKIDVIDPQNGKSCKLIGSINPLSFLLSPKSNNNSSNGKKILLVVMPQLGDFDSSEYAELLCQVLPVLKDANIALRIVGIGNIQTATLFSSFTGIPLGNIRVDPKATVHSTLQLHRGPNWDIPSWIPKSILTWFANDIVGVKNATDSTNNLIARGWLNYMAMCAGIAAPGTIQEILRGYLGDKTAPERLKDDEVVTAGPIAVRGTVDVKLGPIEYQSLWKNEKGYQRPAELATVRLRSMVEVLTKFSDYVPDQTLIDWRGGTFLFDTTSGNILYEYRDRGVLTYSETMNRPLTFLAPYIGIKKALNPLGLADPQEQE